MKNCVLVGKVEISNIEKIKNGFKNFAIFLYNYNVIGVWKYLGTAGMECVVILLIIASIYNKRQAKIFWLQTVYFFVVNIYLWFFIKQRVLLLEFPLLFWCWTCRYNEEKSKIFDKIPVTIYIDLALVVFLMVSMYNYNEIKKDIYGRYTSSYEMEEYIENNIPKGSVFIVTYPQQKFLPVIEKLDDNDYKFYNVNDNGYFTFITWSNEFYGEIPEKEILKAAQKLKSEGVKNIYVMNYVPAEQKVYSQKNNIYEKLFVTDNAFESCDTQKNDFSVYRIK